MSAAPSAAKLVRSAREDAGLSQRELARRARTAQSVVARIESGQTSPTLDTLQRILAAADVELTASHAPKVRFERRLLDDVPRILALSPEDRLRELRNISRFVGRARRV